jgi:hypothetical protein
MFNKLQIRVLKRMKDVYVSVGMPALWQMIDQLSTLADGTPFTEPNLQDWSLKEVFKLAQLTPVGRSHSLRGLSALLFRTQPFDTPYSASANTFSLRELLTNFSD